MKSAWQEIIPTLSTGEILAAVETIEPDAAVVAARRKLEYASALYAREADAFREAWDEAALRWHDTYIAYKAKALAAEIGGAQ